MFRNFNSESINIYKPTLYSIYSIFSRISGYFLIIGIIYLIHFKFSYLIEHINYRNFSVGYYHQFLYNYILKKTLYTFHYIFIFLLIFCMYLFILHIIVGLSKTLDNSNKFNYNFYIILQIIIFILFFFIFFFIKSNLFIDFSNIFFKKFLIFDDVIINNKYNFLKNNYFFKYQNMYKGFFLDFSSKKLEIYYETNKKIFDISITNHFLIQINKNFHDKNNNIIIFLNDYSLKFLNFCKKKYNFVLADFAYLTHINISLNTKYHLVNNFLYNKNYLKNNFYINKNISNYFLESYQNFFNKKKDYFDIIFNKKFADLRNIKGKPINLKNYLYYSKRFYIKNWYHTNKAYIYYMRLLKIKYN